MDTGSGEGLVPLVSEAGYSKAMRVRRKDGLDFMPEASRPLGSFSPPVAGGSEAGTKALLPRAWAHWKSLCILQMEAKLVKCPCPSITIMHACLTCYFSNIAFIQLSILQKNSNRFNLGGCIDS